MTTRSAAHYFLEGLQEIGIEYVFCNLGTDHVSIIEEVARWRQEGRTPPTLILCPHENVAMHMAAGYAMCTGRGQAVLVHVDAGTTNAAMGMHNLCRTRVPVLLFAGKAPFTQHGELRGSRDTFVNFLQEPYDMAGIVRPYAKWMWDLPSGIVVKEALRRAHVMMHSDPPGPVYLTASREVLAAEHPAEAIRSLPAERHAPVSASGVDDAAIAAIGERLLTATRPILITAYAGRHVATPAVIDELAQRTGMRVYESNPTHLGISHDSPCFAGLLSSPELHDADFGLLVDVDVPWLPVLARENPETWWAHIDVDAVKKDFPMWGFPADVRLQADSARMLPRLLQYVGEHQVEHQRAAADARVQELARKRELARSPEPGTHGRINVGYLAKEIGKIMQEDDIVVHEAITNIVPLLSHLPRSKPGTLLGNGGGGLGFGGGVALGAKLAHPERTVFHITGDGSFVFCVPTAVYMVAQQQALPIFTIVLDNCGWGAVKGATQRVYPSGAARSAGTYQSLTGTDVHYEKIADTVGAYGERVEDPAEVPAALARCHEVVRAGRSAILVARIEPVESITPP